ncbi:MAG: hypothetical protein IK113_06030 [Bacteroidales bacterium]|nr:hypothetical protein [Bacteroidales bacterium]
MTNRYTYTPESLLGRDGKLNPFNCIHAISKMLKGKGLTNQSINKALATDFSFSGGEIDNIIRKATIMEVLEGKRPDLHDIKRLCREEKMHGDRARIGFS